MASGSPWGSRREARPPAPPKVLPERPLRAHTRHRDGRSLDAYASGARPDYAALVAQVSPKFPQSFPRVSPESFWQFAKDWNQKEKWWRRRESNPTRKTLTLRNLKKTIRRKLSRTCPAEAILRVA